MYIYIRQEAPYNSEEEYVYYPVLIDREDDEYYYGHYETNGLEFQIEKKKVFEDDYKILRANTYKMKNLYIVKH